MTKTACMSDSTKALKRLVLALVFLGSFFSCFAQLDTAFWYAVPHITHDHAGRPIKLCVSTLGQPATITVRKPAAGNALVGTFTVPANSSQSYQIVGGSQSDLSNITQFECNHNTTSNYGLYIHSTAKVNAYIAVQNNNSEIYALKGGNALGTQFFIPMQYQYTNATNYSDARNSVEVIATENNTSVTITPSVALYGGTHPAHVPFTITLNKGQVYSFASSSQSGANHLCGTVITSNKPIAVDVSDDSATPNGSNQDLVADQLVPEDRAGSEYIVIPSPTAANNTMSGSGLSDYAFIFALEDSTDVSVYYQNGASFSQQSFNNLMRGDKRSYHFTNNTPVFIWARHIGDDGIPVAKPIFVFQLTGAGNELGGTQLPHVYCTGSTAAAYMPLAHPQGSSHVKHLFLTLICAPDYINGFQINGVSSIAASEWQTVPGHTMKYCRKDISSMATQQAIRVTNSLGKFHMGVIDYHQQGTGYDDCSISYFSDYGTKSVLKWSSLMPVEYCQGDTVLFAFDSVEADILRVKGPNGWEILVSDTMRIPNAMPENSGYYIVQGQDSRQCSIDQLSDTVWIDIRPSKEATVYDTICPGMEYEGYGFHVSDDRTENPGTLLDSVLLQTVEYGCDSLLILELYIRDSVKKEVVYDTTCPGEEYFGFGHFHFPADSMIASHSLTDTVSLSPVGYGCDSLLILRLAVRDSAIGEFSHVACNWYSYNGHTYEESGDYPNIVLNNASVNGCDSIVTMHLEIVEPSVDIVTSGDDFCENGELILNAESEFEEYIWNTGETTPFITVTQPGLYTVTVTEGECQASDHYTVPTCEFNIFMPNAITPSRSDGLNDYLFLPNYVHRFLTDFDIEIYNRWGELIYKTNDMNFKWYGEKTHVSDVYVWIIKVKNLDGKQFVYKGTVTVL